MKQIQDRELSALLDGELDSERAAVVRAAIDADPALRKAFGSLVRLDTRLRSAADEAAFMPDVSLPAAAEHEVSSWYWPAGAVAVLALLVARFLPKLAELPLFGISLQVAGCAAISFVVLRMVRETEPLSSAAFGEGLPS